MSLQVWLPLNGSLENQGCGKVVVTNNDGATYYTDGKIGQALNLNKRVSMSCSALDGLSTFSIAFWCKPISSSTISTDWQDILGFQDISTTGTYGQFRFETGYTASYIAGVHWHDNATFAIVNGSWEPVLQEKDIWHHYCVVVTANTSVVSYIDGTVSQTLTEDINGGHLTGTFWMGETDNIEGALNDVRVYDHALSAKEVKELAKGLVLHYKLDNNGMGNPNLINNSQLLDIAAAQTNTYISKRRAADIVRMRTDGFAECYTETSSFGGIGVYANQLGFQVGDTITYSFFIYTNGSSRAFSFYPMMYDSSGTRDTTTKLSISCDGAAAVLANSKTFTNTTTIIPERHYVTFIWNQDVQNILDNGGKIELSIQTHGTWNAGDWAVLYAPKMEYGSIPTAWSPSIADLHLDTSIIYDSSGYCNNAVSNGSSQLTVSLDTPQYNSCTAFVAGARIATPNSGSVFLPKDAITVNIWFKTTAAQNRFLSCTESGGFNFESSSGYVSVPLYITGSGYIHVNSTNTTWSNLSDNQWHMISFTYDRAILSLYIDGQLDTQVNSSYPNKDIGYNASTPFTLGAEAQTIASPITGTYVGNLSDCRIYATALSADDILELYNTSASIDNMGNVYARELVEL